LLAFLCTLSIVRSVGENWIFCEQTSILASQFCGILAMSGHQSSYQSARRWKLVSRFSTSTSTSIYSVCGTT
ncbi:hypothetical protein BX661DRAFT_175022, partial [Kickxella alabastrina]|uniref:uncharacterized protein n=1 Tax=Kickxella alabastrina TaxID=61397 RepID=UPI00222086BA